MLIKIYSFNSKFIYYSFDATDNLSLSLKVQNSIFGKLTRCNELTNNEIFIIFKWIQYRISSEFFLMYLHEEVKLQYFFNFFEKCAYGDFSCPIMD